MGTLVPQAKMLVKGNWDNGLLVEMGAAGQDEVPPQLFDTTRLWHCRIHFLISGNAFNIPFTATVNSCTVTKDDFLHLKEQLRVKLPLVNYILGDI